MNLRHDADAVVVRDGEVVIKHPAGRVGPRSAAVVRRERVEVSHVPVCEQQIVPRAVNVMSNLKIKHTAEIKTDHVPPSQRNKPQTDAER